MATPEELNQQDPLSGFGFSFIDDDPAPEPQVAEQVAPQVAPDTAPIATDEFDAPQADPLSGFGFSFVDGEDEDPFEAVDPASEQPPVAAEIPDAGAVVDEESPPEEVDPLAGSGFSFLDDTEPEESTTVAQGVDPVVEFTPQDPSESASRGARNRIFDLKKELKSDISQDRKARINTQLERLERLSGDLDSGVLNANTAKQGLESNLLRRTYIPAREMLGGLTLGIGDNIFEAIEEVTGGPINAETGTEQIVAGASEALGMVLSGRAIAGGLGNVIKSPNMFKKMLLMRAGTAAIQSGVSSLTDIVDGNISVKDGAINVGTSLVSSLVPMIPENLAPPGVGNFIAQVGTDLATDIFSDTFFRKRLFQKGQDNDWKAWIASEIPNVIMSVFFAGQDLNRARTDPQGFRLQQELTKSDFKRTFGKKAFDQMKSRAKDVHENSDIKTENEDFINNVGRVHGELNNKLKQAIREDRLTDAQKKQLSEGGEESIFSDEAIKRNLGLDDGWSIEIVGPKTAKKMAAEAFETSPEKIGDVEGFADPMKKRIVITNESTGVDRFEVALHEVGHSKYSKDNNAAEAADILSKVREAERRGLTADEIEAELGILPETVHHMKQYLNDNLFREGDLSEEAYVAEKSLREFNDGISSMINAESGRVSDDTPQLRFENVSDEGLTKVVTEQPEVAAKQAVDDIAAMAEGSTEPSRVVAAITKVDPEATAPGVKDDSGLPPVKNTDSELPGEKVDTPEDKYRRMQKELSEGIESGRAREDLGLFTTSPEGQRILDEVDAVRNEQGQPDVRSRAEVEADAQRTFSNDNELEIDRLLTGNNGMETDTDVAVARLAYDEQVRRAMESNSVADDAKASMMAMRIREAGTERARALAERRMPSDPADYNRRMIMGALFEPDAKQRKRLKKLSPEEQLKQLENSQGKNKALAALRKEGIDIGNLSREDFSDPVFAAQIARIITTAKARKMDMAYEWWINSILSSPSTHITNTFGNTLNALWEYGPQRIGEALLNDTLTGLRIKKTPRKRAESQAKSEGHKPGTKEYRKRVEELTTSDLSATSSELSAMYKAVFPSMARAFSMARDTFQAEMPIRSGKLDADGPSKIEVGSRSAKIPGRFGRVVRIPTRFLGAADVMAKTIVSQMEVAAQAHRIAKAKVGSTNSDAFIKEMRHQMENPASESWKKASQKADEITFQNVGDDDVVHKGVMAFRNIPSLRYVLPFVTTPLNIARIGFARSPLGGLRFFKNMFDVANGKKPSSAKVERETVEMMYAVFSLFALSELMSEDDEGRPRITGTFEGDKDVGGEQKFLGSNIPSQSIRIGDKWVKYNRIEPLGTSIALSVDLIDGLKRGIVNKDTDVFSRGLSSGIGIIKDKTFLKGLSDIMKAAEDPKRFGFRWAKNFASSWTPNYLRAGMRNADPLVRDSSVREEGFNKTLKKQFKRTGQAALPLKELAPPARVDIWGRPIEKGQIGFGPTTDWVFQMLSPTQLRKADTFTDMDRAILNYNNSLEVGEDKWYPKMPEGSIQFRNKSWKLDEEMYFEYSTRSGQIAAGIAQDFTDKIDANNPTKAHIETLKGILGRAKAQARRELINNHPEAFGL